MLEISNLEIRYPQFLLKSKKIQLPAQGLVCLNGDNGSGKSTFFRCLTGFETEFQGSFTYQNINLSQNTQQENVKYFSYLPQNIPDLPSISGLELIQQGLYLGGESQQEWLIESLNIEHLMNKKCSHMSGGEKQLLCFVRNLGLKKPITILDEPETFLSKTNRGRLIEIIHRLKGLILVSSHYQENYHADIVLDFEEKDDYYYEINKK